MQFPIQPERNLPSPLLLKALRMKCMTIDKFSEVSRYSKAAIRSKIKRGQWLEGLEWKKAPDGRNLISIEGYERWVEGQAPVPQVGRVFR